MLDYFDRRRRLREMEDEAIREGRLPPGQSLTAKWPVLSAGKVPFFDAQTWRFLLSGEVDQPRELTWEEFTSLPRTQSKSDIHCVTHWTKLDNEWTGIPAGRILELVSINPTAKWVMIHAPGYTANLPLSALLDDDVLFAFTHDGTPLTPEHGGPVRLVVPKRYFWKSVKWVNGLEFLTADEPGYWEQRGYHMAAEPFAEERFGD